MINPECSIYTDEIVPEGSDWYYSLLVCNVTQKKLIQLLLALVKEWEKALGAPREADIPHLKLQWWESELLNTANNHPQHPHTKAFLEFFQKKILSVEDLLKCLKFFISKVETPLPQTEQEWLNQAEGSVFEIVANKILQPPHTLSSEYLRHLNQALMIANSIIHLRYFITYGIIPFPQEALKKFNVEEQKLWALENSPELENLLHHYGRHTENILKSLPNFLSKAERKNQKPILRYTKLQRILLKELARDNYPVLVEHQHLTPIRKLLICWFS